MEVERLTAVLEASGLGTFQANMQAADRATGGTKDQLRALTEISKVATEALKHVKVTAAQAMESKTSAESILHGVKGIGEEARQAARDLDRVKLTQAQATETRIVADEQVRSLKQVEHQAIKTRAAQNGSGGGGGAGGIGRMGLLGAAIGGGVLLGPAAGPGALGLLAAIPVLATTGAGALGTLGLAFQGVGKAIMGNKKAFDGLEASQKQFVLTVRSLDGWFDKLKQTAGAAVFPGLTAGLKAALSPGTVNAITQAVTTFGHAIGDAGKMWGQYFGSSQFQSIFGPLMRAGAGNLSLMADAALHLFDAVGVLGRAALPLVNWMVRGADAAAKWVDSFTRSKDATGGLAGAMNEARTSLQLVGNLFGALAKAVYELGAALYPVSKVAVKDLTNGLTFLAGVFQRNRAAIQDMVSGALAALVATFKAAVPIVAALFHALQWVSKEVGGWKTIFEVVIGGILAAKFYALGLKIAGVVKAIKGIGIAMGLLPKAAATAALATEGAVAAIGTTADGAALKVGGLRGALIAIGDSSVLTALATAAGILLPIAGAIAIGYGIHQDAKATQTFSIPGSNNKHVEFKNGTYTEVTHTSSRGGGAFKRHAITAAQAARLTHGATTAAISPGASTAGGWQTVNIGALSSAPYKKMSAAAAAMYGVPESMFLAQINQESGFNPNAKSKAGALGIAQFMPGTAKGYGINPMDPKQALPAAAKMMSQLYTKYGSWELALAAYNAGSGTVDAYLAGKQGLPKETTNYVKSIMGASSTLPPAGSGAGNDPFGTPPPWTTGLGPKPPKPPKPPVVPAAATNFIGNAKIAASQASALGNTGSAAQGFLEAEMRDYQKAAALIEAKLAHAKGKAATTLTTALDGIVARVVRIQAEIKNAIIVTGDALLPDKLKAKLKKITAQFTADSDYAQVLVGKTADDYRKVLQKDLLGEAAVYQTMLANLKKKLAGASGKQKTAIQAEIAKLTTSLDGVQQQILSNLQANVTSLQSKVGTLFGNVTQQFDDALGKLFFQGGMKTALEQQLADMQAQDQLSSLNDAIQSAKDQLAQDQTGGLAGVQFDATTGLTKNFYSPGAAKQLAADQKALDAATRQLEEYNLGIKAAEERAQMDKEYASQVTTLNRKLADLADSFQNGTGSMQQLRDLASQYGIVITNQSIPDFKDLSSASTGLKAAFKDLADYIATITGATPKIPDASNAANLANSSALGNAQAAAAANPTPANIASVITALRDAGYTQSTGYLGRAGMIPGFASGGIVKAKPGGTIIRVAEAGQDEQIGPVGGRGGTMTVEMHIHALDPNSVEWGPIAAKIQAELLRTQKRNGGTTGIR